MSLLRKIAAVLWAGIVAYLIALTLQGVWTALLLSNLRTVPSFPWSVPVMALILVPAWKWLGGSFAPSRTAENRRKHLRAFHVDARLFLKSVVAGVFGLAALCGLWIVFAETVEVPTSALPDLGKYSPLMAYSVVAMGALVGAVLEEAGFRGYAQTMLAPHFKTSSAVLLTSALFAIGPHPPAHGFLVPKIVFYFLVALLLACITEVTSSILPAIAVHVLGLAIFFILIWPHDVSRHLIWSSGADRWFWIHVVQSVIFAAVTVFLLKRLSVETNVKVLKAAR